MEDIPLRFLDPTRPVVRTGGGLPHMEQEGSCYFITFRLADSLPRELLDSWARKKEAWVEKHPLPWDCETEQEYHLLFSAKIEAWLDAGYGGCLLSDEKLREIVFNKLMEGHRRQYSLHAVVVMPNHAHVLVSLAESSKLARIMQGWKGGSARAINLETGDTGSVWQRDYFDRLVRDARHFHRGVRYIRNNPVKAGLGKSGYLLWFREGVDDSGQRARAGD